jgi:hypothetical protein
VFSKERETLRLISQKPNIIWKHFFITQVETNAIPVPLSCGIYFMTHFQRAKYGKEK